MKPKITPRNAEVEVPKGRFIVSKTDLTGRITYVNRTFMEVADYTEADLLRQQHNIIRHPDMPRGAFQFLWDEIKQGREFFAYVKNLASNGAYYWVFANITPDYDDRGKVQGYYSVRRRPSPEAIAAIQPVYAEMLRIEKASSPKEAPFASVKWLSQQLEQMGKSYEQFVLGLFH